MAKIILLVLAIFIFASIVLVTKNNSSKFQSNTLKNKSDYLCDNRQPCKKELPKGVCIPGGSCTSS